MTIPMLLTMALMASEYASASGSGPFSDLFSYDEYLSMTDKRIRREVRDLTEDQWDRIADALNLMKNMSTEHGRALFGNDYVNYDVLTCQHAQSTLYSQGDTAHFHPVFNPWHRAFLLRAENSLIAIDPEIEGLPYLDFRRDVIEQNSTFDLSESVIFSDQYFGDYNSFENEYFAVSNGKFAFWKIHDDPASLGCDNPYSQNVYGLLRSVTSIESSPYLTRYGGSMCNGGYNVCDIDVYNECLYNVTKSISDFYYCMGGLIHGGPHLGIGGTRLAYDGQPSVGFPFCMGWSITATTEVCPDMT